MKQQSIFQPGATITTAQGTGTLVMVKPGNFRNQNYKVQFPNGQARWYTLTQLQDAYRIAA